MTKPDDIDQDAWEKAHRSIRSMTSRPMSEIDVASAIARAIMSARAEEREACARLAEIWPTGGASIEMVEHAAQELRELAAAIRSRP
jgi:hypothetical protein